MQNSDYFQKDTLIKKQIMHFVEIIIHSILNANRLLTTKTILWQSYKHKTIVKAEV